ncbi:electron transfer flavoprotein subunit beta/FixA family protein [Actinoplanes regularis]|uniref:Electron transfer flavoprotein beta subunit n=1 Tax=Actinoplanes regularis TaxID=52697 RepID=A0A238YMW4_9ACTN|nr:electron transfer flavoprotein subunit beta/FixA family protein [Actinoplanes regularis]GIE85380.1 electron transfer flavoprotein subunit beta [Actinoplanes regularis]GLW29000.1 electron transfer flavoprotein subunit beta [Actinoplanes regularis]SNR71953.1 electron transfer flavoprotein beta subunit [Actinoplanes regularis]
MKIVVLVKHVPCTLRGMTFGVDHTLDRAARRGQLNEADEYAVDQALRIARRRRDVQITAVTMGPAAAVGALRKALILGADDAVHVLDDRLHGSHALATARVLAAAVGRLGFDLVLSGSASSDSGMSAVPAMVAELLGVPVLCFADTLRVGEHRVQIGRDDGAGLQVFAAALPAVVAVTERCGEPRWPTFTATADAHHKLIRTWTLADLGVAGNDATTTVVRAVTAQPGGATPVLLAGDPTVAAIRVADFLAVHQFL